MNQKQYQILIVEDEKNHAELISRALENYEESLNFKVVDKLQLAKNEILSFKPELIIADWKLPDGEGIELLTQQKNEEIPVIIMTSFGSEKFAVESFKAGAMDYIIKSPETLSNIYHTIIRTIREWEMRIQKKNSDEQIKKENELNIILLDLHKNSPNFSNVELYQYILEKVVQLTNSKIGFFHRVSDDGNTIILTTWNKEALNNCMIPNIDHYPIDQAGNWVDCVKEKKTIIYNDYLNSPNRKGMPEGHTELKRFLSTPVLDGDKVTIIFGVGNKPTDYTEFDSIQIQIIANELQKIIKQRHYEEKLKSSLVEKEVLLRELYHRTKNNMQVISSFLQLHSIYNDNDEKLNRIIKDVVSRIQAMSLVHQKLYISKNLSRINLNEYISELANVLLNYYEIEPNAIEIFLDIENIDALIDIAIPIGIIINEILINIIQYSFPNGKKGSITLKLSKHENDSLLILISDNGNGLANGIDFKKINSLGMITTISIIEQQLQGNIEFESLNGLTCRIIIKNNLYKERV